MHNQKGFTMIEFMVVAILIGLLMTLGGGAYIKSMSRGRDARKIEDIQAIQKGFELYYTKTDRGIYDEDDTTCNTMKIDTAIFPNDQVFNQGYQISCPNSSSYCICAALDPRNVREFGNSTTENCNFAPKGDDTLYYCVRNLQ